MSAWDSDLDDQNDEEEVGQTDPRDDMKRLRALAKKGKQTEALEAQLAEANKKLAFASVGIDVTTPMGELFFNGYKGEMTKEAVLEMAAKVGLPTPGAAPAQPASTTSEASPTNVAATAAAASQNLANESSDLASTGGAGTAHDQLVASILEHKAKDLPMSTVLERSILPMLQEAGLIGKE